MSRDFIPAETHAFWQELQRKGHGSLLDKIEKTTLSYAGKTSPLYSKESMENRRKYPLLGSLYSYFDDAYKLLSNTKDGMELLSRLENELDSIIKTKNGNENSYVFKWFIGKLDPGFYYAQENDRLLLEAIKDDLTYCSRIDAAKITDTARISVSWDSYGIAVDMNYAYDEAQGYGESMLCFCETYENGSPSEDVWDEALRIGDFLKDKYNVPLVSNRDEAWIRKAENKQPTLNQQIQAASVRVSEEKTVTTERSDLASPGGR